MKKMDSRLLSTKPKLELALKELTNSENLNNCPSFDYRNDPDSVKRVLQNVSMAINIYILNEKTNKLVIDWLDSTDTYDLVMNVIVHRDIYYPIINLNLINELAYTWQCKNVILFF